MSLKLPLQLVLNQHWIPWLLTALVAMKIFVETDLLLWESSCTYQTLESATTWFYGFYVSWFFAFGDALWSSDSPPFFWGSFWEDLAWNLTGCSRIFGWISGVAPTSHTICDLLGALDDCTWAGRCVISRIRKFVIFWAPFDPQMWSTWDFEVSVFAYVIFSFVPCSALRETLPKHDLDVVAEAGGHSMKEVWQPCLWSRVGGSGWGWGWGWWTSKTKQGSESRRFWTLVWLQKLFLQFLLDVAWFLTMWFWNEDGWEFRQNRDMIMMNLLNNTSVLEDGQDVWDGRWCVALQCFVQRQLLASTWFGQIPFCCNFWLQAQLECLCWQKWQVVFGVQVFQVIWRNAGNPEVFCQVIWAISTMAMTGSWNLSTQYLLGLGYEQARQPWWRLKLLLLVVVVVATVTGVAVGVGWEWW